MQPVQDLDEGQGDLRVALAPKLHPLGEGDEDIDRLLGMLAFLSRRSMTEESLTNLSASPLTEAGSSPVLTSSIRLLMVTNSLP